MPRALGSLEDVPRSAAERRHLLAARGARRGMWMIVLLVPAGLYEIADWLFGGDPSQEPYLGCTLLLLAWTVRMAMVLHRIIERQAWELREVSGKVERG